MGSNEILLQFLNFIIWNNNICKVAESSVDSINYFTLLNDMFTILKTNIIDGSN